MKRPDWTYGFFYRRWSRLLHRFNLHQTRDLFMEDGATITKCDWCGLGQRRGPRRFPGDRSTLDGADATQAAPENSQVPQAVSDPHRGDEGLMADYSDDRDVIERAISLLSRHHKVGVADEYHDAGLDLRGLLARSPSHGLRLSPKTSGHDTGGGE